MRNLCYDEILSRKHFLETVSPRDIAAAGQILRAFAIQPAHWWKSAAISLLAVPLIVSEKTMIGTTMGLIAAGLAAAGSVAGGLIGKGGADASERRRAGTPLRSPSP